MNYVNRFLNLSSDVLAAYKNMPFANTVPKRVAVAAAVMPILSLGSAYLNEAKDVGFNWSGAATGAATMAAGWLGIEAAGSAYNLAQSFIDRVQAARVDREHAQNQKQLLNQVRKEILKIQKEIALGASQPTSELGAIQTHLTVLSTILQGARTAGQLGADADSFAQLQNAHSLVLENWGYLVAQNADAVGHVLRNQSILLVPNHPTLIDYANLQLLNRQLKENFPAKIKEEIDDLDRLLAAALLRPAEHPQTEYANLKAQFAVLDAQVKTVRPTDADITQDRNTLADLKKAKQLVLEIWTQLQTQKISIAGNALRHQLTVLVPMPANAVSCTDLTLLHNQLDLRGKADQKIAEVSDIKTWNALLGQLESVKQEQERIQSIIPSLQRQILELETEIVSKTAQAAAASTDKPLFGRSPQQIILNEVSALEQKKLALQSGINTLREGLLRMDYFTGIPNTIRHLQKQPSSPERDQYIVELQAIQTMQNQISSVPPGPNQTQIQARLREQIQTRPELQTACLDKRILQTQTEISKLPQIADIQDVLNKLTNVQTALNAVVAQAVLNTQNANYENLAKDIPPPPVVRPQAQAAAAAPVVHRPAAPEPRWYETRFVQIGAAAIGGTVAAGAALLTLPVAATAGIFAAVGGGVALDHLKGKQRAQKAWQKYMGEEPQQAPAQRRLLVEPPAADPYAGLGRVGSAQYQLQEKTLRNEKLNLDFSSRLIRFPVARQYGNAAASLQLLANVKPLMYALGHSPLVMVEKDFFSQIGVAQLGKNNPHLEPRKQAALVTLAQFFQSDRVLWEEEVLTQLRELTHDGKIGEIKGLAAATQKLHIARLLVRLELKNLYRTACENSRVSADQVQSLVRAAEIFRKCLAASCGNPKNDYSDPLLLDPSNPQDSAVDPEMLTILMARALDGQERLCAIYRAEEPELRQEHPVVFVRNPNFEVESKSREMDMGPDKVKYQFVGTLEKHSLSGDHRACLSKEQGLRVYENAATGAAVRAQPHPGKNERFQPQMTVLVRS